MSPEAYTATEIATAQAQPTDAASPGDGAAAICILLAMAILAGIRISEWLTEDDRDGWY